MRSAPRSCDSPSHLVTSIGIEGGIVKTVKSIAASGAALAVIGGAAAGIAAIAPSSGPAQVRLAAIAAPSPATGWGHLPLAGELPLPQDPPPGQNLPAPDQVSSLCTQATDPGVSYTTKTNLVENGISPDEGRLADHDLRKAYRDGKFPESFNVTNIQPAGPNAATADVAISGPKFAGPVTKNLMFVNQGGNWILQHDAAIALLQAATG
jgi:hypothetical protein